MLREVANLVHAQFREYDFLARYAGDEFVAIVPDVAADQVEELRERIERTVSDFSIEIRAKGRAGWESVSVRQFSGPTGKRSINWSLPQTWPCIKPNPTTRRASFRRRQLRKNRGNPRQTVPPRIT